MIINILKRCKQKRENKNIKPFAEFYLHSCYSPAIEKIDIDCPDKKNNQRNAPDYFLLQPKIAIEVKEVHEREELEKSVIWSRNIKRLKKELNSRNLNFFSGAYLINTPSLLRVKHNKVKDVIDGILNGIRNDNPTVNIEGIGEFKINKYGNKGKSIVFDLIGSVRSINPAGTIHQNISPKIETANKQLGAIKRKVSKKILLFVNRYLFADDPKEFIETLTYSYNDLLKYKNIDEIWLQFEAKDGQFLHALIYTYNFLNSFNDKKIKTDDEINKQLFEKWFYPLEKLGDEHKEKLFSALKQFLKDKKPYQLFADKFTREEMARLGIWSAEKRRFKDAIWIIDKFIDDPDPEEPKKYSGDPEFNYHQQIINGEDLHIITTVLGHLAWVVQKLSVRKNYIVKALNYTKKLLSHKNLYVKLQAIIPLIEIAGRRQWLEGWGKRPREGQYKEFHEIVFNLVNLVAKNPSYKAIAKWLCHVFAYYKDLSTSEVEQVLNALKITDEVTGLFVYFGIFRQRHYKDQDIEYNGQKLEKRLKEIILKSSKEDHQRLRASITWHLWKVLDENRNEFKTIKPYIDLILKQPYQSDIYDDIERIISGWIKDKPDICIHWYKQMLSKVSEYTKHTKKLQLRGGLWLMYTEEIVETIAKHNPNELLEIMEKLVSFWKKGVFVGSPKRLFESFRVVPNEEQRIEVKRKLQRWYNSMRKLNPKIEKVDWD